MWPQNFATHASRLCRDDPSTDIPSSAATWASPDYHFRRQILNDQGMTNEGDKEGGGKKSQISSVDPKEAKDSVTKGFYKPPLLIEPSEPKMPQEEPASAYRILTHLL